MKIDLTFIEQPLYQENLTKKVWQKALVYLAQREYSIENLKNKLLTQGFAKILVEEIIAKLIAKNWLDDNRFCELYVHSSVKKGQGPIRIIYDLKQAKIDLELIDFQLKNYEQQWAEYAEKARIKKFGKNIPNDIKTKTTQMHFLQRRGFSLNTIKKIFLNKNRYDNE